MTGVKSRAEISSFEPLSISIGISKYTADDAEISILQLRHNLAFSISQCDFFAIPSLLDQSGHSVLHCLLHPAPAPTMSKIIHQMECTVDTHWQRFHNQDKLTRRHGTYCIELHLASVLLWTWSARSPNSNLGLSDILLSKIVLSNVCYRAPSPALFLFLPLSFLNQEPLESRPTLAPKR